MTQATLDDSGSACTSLGPELIANGDFHQGAIGGVPDGWTVMAPNPVLAPTFALVQSDDGRRALQAQGNGRPACMGWIQTLVTLRANTTYRLCVEFHSQGLDDVNHHLVHGVFSLADDGAQFNQGVFSYRWRDGRIVGTASFRGPAKDSQVTVRLYFRHSASGRVCWDRVSLRPCQAISQRLVKIAVTQGAQGLDHWAAVLTAAGQAGCDVALLPEMFDQNSKPMEAPTLDGAAVRLLADQARRYAMYVAGSLYLRRGDLVYNSAPLFDRLGNLVGIHDKNVLYEPELNGGATCGDQLSVFTTDLGKVGIMTCYESWFPAVAQLLALRGAELILFPSAGYYTQLIHARSADNGVVIAASSLGGDYDVWDTAGNRAGGEAPPDPSRHAPTNIIAIDRRPGMKLMLVTVDLSQQPSPHCWGGPMYSAPGGRRVRNTCPADLEQQVAGEARRWCDDQP